MFPEDGRGEESNICQLESVSAIFGCQRQRLWHGRPGGLHPYLVLPQSTAQESETWVPVAPLPMVYAMSEGTSLCCGFHGTVRRALWAALTWEWYLNRHQLSSTAPCLASPRNPKCWCLKYIVNYSLRSQFPNRSLECLALKIKMSEWTSCR